MGHLYYGTSTEPIEIPDSLLAHLKVVITTKLRRSESFTLAWRHEGITQPGRSAIWLQHSIPLRFVFESPEPEQLRASALQEFVNQANSSAGLTVDVDAWMDEAGLVRVS
ncbi:hypothetical protein [Microbacterium immunditiarum]|uniref:DUF7882 domain-containing protein n=1 Tax=Microbacterium immunditiarum TaxID=337480 RepID=A0A7Y9GM45_9MICO|nr:hypothetical protein [Microbacterium immunditiarum]NYE19023.1 hypothetical protein [Microbacterium immunditiarum]